MALHPDLPEPPQYIVMHPIKKMLTRHQLLSKMIRPPVYACIWILLKTEKLFALVADRIIRFSIPVFRRNSTYNRRIHQLLSKTLSSERLTDKMVKQMRYYRIEVPASLASSVFCRNTYCSQLQLPEWKINDKLSGIRLAKKLGLKTPRIYYEHTGVEQIRPTHNMVIKPAKGSSGIGVFMSGTKGGIRELNTGKHFNSWGEFLKAVREMLSNNIIESDNWLAEELICQEQGKPAVDFKFYTFYGKVGWITEIIRFPEPKFHIMDGQGNTIDGGTYSKSQLFRGTGPTPSEIETARKVSLEIPAPFIRIDFLKGSDGMYFGEFTPRSGIIGSLPGKRDREYGKMFHDAEARLYDDLIGGKSFDTYRQISS